MNRALSIGVPTLVVFAALTSCSGGSSTGVRPGMPDHDFVVLQTAPVDNGIAYLNDPIRIDFSAPVDLDSASLDTVTFHVFDQIGRPLAESVSGTFRLGRSAGDAAAGRQLVFAPHLPTSNSFDDGGLRSGRNYIVQLVGGTGRNGTTLRSDAGRALEAAVSFRFGTADGTSPAQLFRNPKAGGPRRLPVDGLLVSTATDLDRVPLNLLGGPPVEIRLQFDQALNPHDKNVPVHFDTNPILRHLQDRGRIFLEYDDPVAGNNTWLPADVEIERNDLDGATVVLRPVGVLPNNAAIRVIVESTVEDISGESNVADLAYDRVFGTFRTDASYAQQFTAVVDDFLTADAIDFGAVFPEPLADVRHGVLAASFDFAGNTTSLEYEPTAQETVLNTSFTQVVPKSGLPFNVSGGVFNFARVRIQQGVSVRGQGPNPMVWLCSGDFIVEGELSVGGGNGARVDTLTSANFAKAGGVGVCGGGNGGPGSPSGTRRDPSGAPGNGPLQVPGAGGGGGLLDCASGCYAGNGGGSGGGGGTLATQGDPYYRAPATTGTVFQQRRGHGGTGCSGTATARTGVLAGGNAAPRVFVDSRADNDFWGAGINFASNLRVPGELTMPVGGGGGGGGGDRSHNLSCSTTDGSFATDNSGGGGGGGGGVLIVKALGEIVVNQTGRIVADGGLGGGGEQSGSCNQGGGGGGGAGGMIVLMSSKRIVLHTHGTSTRWNYAQSDYDFVISADGGVTRTGTFGGPLVTGKYPPSGQVMMAGDQYDSNPLGGLGGLGVVQLMAPPGDNLIDDTNTRLDDNIDVFRNGALQNGVDKQAILAWRGFQDAAGVFVDDEGDPIDIGNNEGDIRPAPILLPAPFASKSRLRSKWIDTGSSQRRPLAAEDGLPRGIVLEGANVVGPVYEFAGVQTSGSTAGYAAYEPAGPSSVRIAYPITVAPIDVVGASDGARHLGTPAYAIELASALDPVADRYRDFEAELLDQFGSTAGSFRIASHAGSRVLLAPDGRALPAGIVRLQVRAKLFKVVTAGSEGLGPAHVPVGQSTLIPKANVRIGFAFHRDPATGAAGRYPLDPQDFVHDMADAGLQTWIQNNGAPRYVQWDVTFDSTFRGLSPLGPDSPRPELHFLRLPFRF